jgi:hypothetical protein
VHRIVLDVSRLRELVALDHTPLVDGIARTWGWLRAVASEVA